MPRFHTIRKNPFDDGNDDILLVVDTSRLVVAIVLALRGEDYLHLGDWCPT
jgi:hypothetical protein